MTNKLRHTHSPPEAYSKKRAMDTMVNNFHTIQALIHLKLILKTCIECLLCFRHCGKSFKCSTKDDLHKKSLRYDILEIRKQAWKGCKWLLSIKCSISIREKGNEFDQKIFL